MPSLEFPPLAPGLLSALAIGFLIGLERGWTGRELPAGGRVAGLRTFTLVGLFGGVLASMPEAYGLWPLVGGLVGLAVLVSVSYWRSAGSTGNLSVTSAVAMLLTMTLGAFAASGEILTASVAAVVVTLLLNLKPALHRWLRLIDQQEMTAALQLLVLSVVIWPYLPDMAMGPYGAINPYRIWLAVILIAGLSMAGHVAMRLTDTRRGILWTGALGGLASSTAVTLALSRFARHEPALTAVAAKGILAGSCMMCLRIMVLLLTFRPELLQLLVVPLTVSALVLIGLVVRGADIQPVAQEGASELFQKIPVFSLGSALGFGALLACVEILVPFVREFVGSEGVFALAALSGVADVDAITISLSQQVGLDGLVVGDAALAICLAVSVNLVAKGVLAYSIGGRALALLVARGFALSAFSGCAVFMMFQ